MNVNNISKERFEKAKKGIIKKYPGAKTMVDPQGKYYVATADGRAICNLQVGQAINSYEFNDASDLYGFNSTLDKINKVKEETVETSTQSKHYMAIIDMMERFPANNGVSCAPAAWTEAWPSLKPGI